MATETKRVYDIQVNGTESFNDLKKAIEELNEKLKTLNQSSKEYKETLEELEKLQSKFAESMTTAKDVLQGFGEIGNEVVESFLTGFVEGLQEAASATTETNVSTLELDESLTKEATSVKELRDQINGLKDRLVQLNVDSKEYKETVELLVEKNNKLQSVLHTTKDAVSAVTGSYNALSQEMAALRKRWKETSDEAERSQIGKRINEINTELKKMDESIGNYQRNVGSYAKSLKDVFGNPRQQIRELRKELSGLEVGSQRYNEVLMEMADLTQRQKHFQDQLRFSSSNLEDIFSNLAGVASGVAGGFSALNAAMGLFGNQNDDVQKAMLRTQQMMALVQGLKGLAGLKDKIVGLIDGMKGFASRFTVANKNTKDFAQNTKTVAGASQEATGALDAQATAVSRLSVEMEHLNEEERKTVDVVSKEMTEREAQLAILDQEYQQKLKLAEISNKEGVHSKEWEDTAKEYNEKANAIRAEVEERQKVIDKIAEETRQRMVLNGVLTEEQATKLKDIELAEREQTDLLRKVEVGKKVIKTNEEEIKVLVDKMAREEELTQKEEIRLAILTDYLEKLREETAQNELEYKMREKDINATKTQITTQVKLDKALKTQLAERKELNRLKVLSNAQITTEIWQTRALINAEKADAAQKKGLAATYRGLATAAKVASISVKTVKTALISSGIGALLVLFGTLVSNVIEGFTEWASVAKRRLNKELGILNAHTKELEAELKEIQQIADGLGFSDFKKSAMEITKQIEIMRAKQEEFDFAIERGKKDTDELRDAWYEAQDTVNDSLMESELMINKLILDVEKADRQKGMTQLEKDLEETNKQFQDAIDLVKTFGEQGVWSADRVEAKIASLNNALAKQTQMLTEAAASADTATTKTGKSKYEQEKEEAERLYKETVEYYKKEEQKLKEKYEKEKKLMEKFHKDTTLLTKKYYEDLDKLRIEHLATWQEKYFEHLDSILSLENNGTEAYLTKQIDTLKEKFDEVFGSLEQYGEGAFRVTKEIADQMKMMGLDPEDYQDVEKMTDKWFADKKAIEDAEKALAKFKSSLKLANFEQYGEAIEKSFDYALTSLENEYSLLETESAKMFGLETGFYTGLSPKQLEKQFEERYQIMEFYLNQEEQMWRNAVNDETLTLEDRNVAKEKLDEVMLKKGQMAIQKEIDANDLLIRSFERVTDSMSSMADNIANILGTVSEIVEQNAERQLEAGKMSQAEYNRQFEKSKNLQIAQATINTIAGAVGAFMGITRDTGGWGIAAAAVEAAAVLASGFAQIWQIRNTKATGGSSTGSGGANAFSLPSVMIPEPQRVQNTTSQEDIDALRNALGDQRVVLVESDVTIAQGKAKKVNVESTF